MLAIKKHTGRQLRREPAYAGGRRIEAMIFFVAPLGEAWEIEDYLKTYGKELSHRARVLTWDQNRGTTRVAAWKLRISSD